MARFLLRLAWALALCQVFTAAQQADEGLDVLRLLRGALAPVGDGDLRSFRVARPRAPVSGTKQLPKVVGACGAIMNKAFAELQSALQSDPDLAIQKGDIDFGFLGDENETQACAKQTCAYTNPTSPYGLTVLPLALNETLNQKLTRSLPDFVRQDMQQRRQASDGSTASSSWFSRLRSSSGSTSTSGSASSSSSRGLSAAWQISSDEVVMVVGCLPPANASRYFAWTHYTADNWVSVFASMGDSIGAYTQAGDEGVRNRLNSTLPNLAMSQQQSAPGPGGVRGRLGGGVLGSRLSPLGSKLGAWLNSRSGGDGGGIGNGNQGVAGAVGLADVSLAEGVDVGTVEGAGGHPWANIGRADDVQLVASNVQWAKQQQSLRRSTKDAASTLDEPYDRFSIVLMSSSPQQVAKVQAVLQSVLERLGLLRSVVFNVLPISPPFSGQAGLAERNAYFLLLARNILGLGQLPTFREYLAGSPWRAWRISPASFSATARRPLVTAFSERIAQRLPTTVTPPDSYPPAKVIPRTSKSLNQSEGWLRPAFNWLLKTVDQKLQDRSMTTSWSLTSDSALQGAGIDWGIDCFNRRIDFCNGDNRDAQYIISLPFLTLGLGKVLYVVGVNHVSTGLATYMNVAPSDPIQRLGLAAWDDQELIGSADAMMAQGPYAGLSKMFYIASYSRNCTGLPYCKEIPVSGARALPLTRPIIVFLRAYVNPVTGVGANASVMVNFRTVVATPSSRSRPRDNDALQLLTPVMGNSPCKTALTSLVVSCPQVLRPAAQPQSVVGAFSNASIHGQPVTQALWAGVSAVVPALDDISQSDCCASVASWTENKCFCNAAGNALMSGLLPLPTRALIAGIGRACGQPIVTSLSSCI